MSRPDSDFTNPYAPPKAVSDDPLASGTSVVSGGAGYVRYLVLAALCVSALVAYVQRNSVSVAEAAIRDELGLSKQEMGYVMSAFFLTYALFQLPTGWIVKMLGTRRALPVFSGLFSGAAAAFAVSFNLPMFVVTRLGMGASQAGIFPAAVTTIAKWIPPTNRTLANGLLTSCMSAGGVLGALLTGYLMPLIGWRWTFAFYSVPGFLFAVWFYLWFRDSPAEHSAVSPEELRTIQSDIKSQETPHPEPASGTHEPTPWGAILMSLPMWALCAQQVFRAAGYMFFASWFTTFLRETRGVKDVEAGVLTSLPLLAVVVGSPVGGWLADWILVRTGSRRWSRQGLSIVCMFACSVLIVMAYPVANAWLAVLLISAGSFFSSFAGPVAYTAAIDLGGKHVPIVFSLMNMAGNIGAFLFPIVVPWVLNEQGDPGNGNWTLVLFLFAGMYLAAALFWMLADTRRAIS